MVIGCGDGGCCIVSDIYKACQNDDVYTIAYNTSNRNLGAISAHRKLNVVDSDGAGRNRSAAKNLFKRDIGSKALAIIKNKLDEAEAEGRPFSYIMVFATTDGGTGSGTSPMFAKYIFDNTTVPVIICGVYPSLSEDAQSLYNAIEWQREVSGVGVSGVGIPYIILNNNIQNQTKTAIHSIVNAQAVDVVKMIIGSYFGNSVHGTIDNQNLYMLLAQQGKRIVIASSEVRPTSQQSLDDYLEVLVRKCNQPMPSAGQGLAVFVKGTEDLIRRLDTSIPDFCERYTAPILKFPHIEVSSTIRIGIIISGCEEPIPELSAIKARYDDLMAAASRHSAFSMSDFMNGMNSPMTIKTRVITTTDSKSAFEL